MIRGDRWILEQNRDNAGNLQKPYDVINQMLSLLLWTGKSLKILSEL